MNSIVNEIENALAVEPNCAMAATAKKLDQADASLESQTMSCSHGICTVDWKPSKQAA